MVYPQLAAARAELEKSYCADNGRLALEPVLMLGVSLLQELDGVPDRQAVELLRYHAGWNFALNRQLGDPVFHPTRRVNFRRRLHQHGQGALAFQKVLDALVGAGLVSRQCRQRLDWTPMFGRVARMNRLDCVRESLRLAWQELEGVTAGPQAQLLQRIFGEQFAVVGASRRFWRRKNHPWRRRPGPSRRPAQRVRPGHRHPSSWLPRLRGRKVHPARRASWCVATACAGRATGAWPR